MPHTPTVSADDPKTSSGHAAQCAHQLLPSSARLREPILKPSQSQPSHLDSSDGATARAPALLTMPTHRHEPNPTPTPLAYPPRPVSHMYNSVLDSSGMELGIRGLTGCWVWKGVVRSVSVGTVPKPSTGSTRRCSSLFPPFHLFSPSDSPVTANGSEKARGRPTTDIATNVMQTKSESLGAEAKTRGINGRHA
ncbi:uncharacterized protein UV8b_03580 [Ustilaginoidea virens]|uniref:Uncharacterized protein n=1 Tax=Ustilaginoidea virens TaxID=1159556 RepID=A0A8E5HPL5_USTVR|nr:uncharacterized protein UV8b_03580 [Ustilaginoidea virens]QUC19339.1 hypothetical protein UV8b_03580 [Ustilaginoidea virens]